MYRYAISYDTFWTTLEQSFFTSLGRPGFWTGQTQVAPSKSVSNSGHFCPRVCRAARRRRMTMTAEEVRYHGDFFRSSDPARHRLGGGGRHPPSYGRGEPSDASFERYFSTTAGRRGGTFGVEPVGRGSSEREVGTLKELSAQLREVQVSARRHAPDAKFTTTPETSSKPRMARSCSSRARDCRFKTRALTPLPCAPQAKLTERDK